MATAAVLAGIGAWVPPTIVTNDDLAPRLHVTDEWIYRRTGIRRRHVVGAGLATGDLAVEAGALALKSARETTVDAVVVATTTPDHLIPATAPAVAARLGLAGALAFDLNAVCAGFVYGLASAAALVVGGLARRVLMIGADTVSTVVDPEDQVVSPLFGDGAGAVVLRAGDSAEAGALTAFDLGSDGDLAHLIMVPAGGARQRSSGSGRPDPNDMYLTMDGRRVFTTAVTRMTQSSRAVLERAGRSATDLDWLVGHQANVRILRSVATQLELPEERLVMNIDRVGNTSAASIPLALTDALAQGVLRPGHLVLLTAFGAGLAWGSTLLTWPDLPPS